jgi:hypothetical protein
MAAFNYTQPVDATGETTTEQQLKPKADIYPNVGGQAGVHYNGNFATTDDNELPQGMLWTALYGLAGPNTITIQFSAPLVTVSTTTSDYTLSGPGGTPSISSVTYGSGSSLSTGFGSRNVVLNLSGPLVATNTYTLSIGTNKVHSGDINIDGTGASNAHVGVYNWPGYTVDVILPAEIDCTGVGIEQDIALGDPNINTAGASVGTGFSQPIDLGTPVANCIVAETGVGIEQDIVLGTPDSEPNVVNTATGIAQAQGKGTPVVTQQQEPIGVGIAQTISVGSAPVADINPLAYVTPTGISQVVAFGNPVAAGSADVHGVGIEQDIILGSPLMECTDMLLPHGTGIAQIIDVGQAPTGDINPITVEGGGIVQTITLGTGSISIQANPVGGNIAVSVDFGNEVADLNPLAYVTPDGIEQDIGVGTPDVKAEFFGVGIEQDIGVGTPDSEAVANAIGVGIEQDVDLGDPDVITAFQVDVSGVGIEQDIDFGDPLCEAPNELVGVGIEQDIVFGTPSETHNAHPHGVGIAQAVTFGSPVIVVEAEPVGVGIAQTISLGTPVGDINPLTPTGVGVNEIINVGASPHAVNLGSITGVGIAQSTSFGLPDAENGDQTTHGSGFTQPIDLGTGAIVPHSTCFSVYFEQPCAVGQPSVGTIHPLGSGFVEPITLGTPGIHLNAPVESVGVQQDVVLGTPVGFEPGFPFGVGFVQPIAVGVPSMQHSEPIGVGIAQDVEFSPPRAMKALTITHRQHLAMEDLDAALHKAFGFGVDDGTNDLIDKIDDYQDTWTPLQQVQCRACFEDVAAPSVAGWNMPGAWSNTNDNDNVTLAKLAPTGITGSMQFVDGFLVARTNQLGIECIAVGIAQGVGVGTPDDHR